MKIIMPFTEKRLHSVITSVRAYVWTSKLLPLASLQKYSAICGLQHHIVHIAWVMCAPNVCVLVTGHSWEMM